MEYRTLDLKIISAKGLKNVNFISKLEVYAVVSIAGGDPRAKQRTPTDRDGGVNPAWNFPMRFTVDEAAAQQNRLTLVVGLRADRALGDRDVGEVHVPIKEIIGDNKSVQFVRYQVRKPNGKAKGELNFSYQFSEKVAASHVPPQASHVTRKTDEPVTAYPAVAPMATGTSSTYPPPVTSAYPPVTSSGYPPAGYPQGGAGGYGYPPPPPPPPPPQQPGYGYQPQQPGYGYPGQQAGYGYPPQQGYGYAAPLQQPPKKNKFGGGGMGLGLLGGALGGLLIGDMISDVGSYDAGYDAGFDDAGGFDF